MVLESVIEMKQAAPPALRIHEDTGNLGDAPNLAALSPWAPELARTFVSLASDIALVIDSNGVIRNVAQGAGEPIAPGANDWVGRDWIDTVSGDTRPKIENLLKEVTATGIARRREVTHPLAPGGGIPVAYTAIRLGENGPVLAVGRDLRAIAAIQQRYVESQKEMERGYWHVRQAEARYELLFQVATDAVIVVDAETLLIVEANHAAAQLFGASAEQLRGQHASVGFEHHSRGALNELLGRARTGGQGVEIRARMQGSAAFASVAATPFRADDAMRLLVRVREAEPAFTAATLNKTLARLVDDASDGVVVTDSSGRIQVANPAFLALVQLPSEAGAKGQPLMGWLGMAEQPLAELVPAVRREGLVRHLGAWLKRAGGPAIRVDISAALLTEGDQECIGFTIHPSADAAGARAGTLLTHTLRDGIEALCSELGVLGLPAMLREATALAERHFVQLALSRSGGDLTAAAGLLGMTRDSLVRLQDRFQAPTRGQPDPHASSSAA
jgi:transcriptional regulator PpsR